MGLDGVELIMRVEEEFEIEISDAEAELCSTPGALCALIERKLNFAEAERRCGCPTSRAFYRVRRQLMQAGIERARIKPTARLDFVLPRSHRRQRWSDLSEALGLSLPPLVRSPEWAFIGLLPLGVLPLCLVLAPATATALCFACAALWWLGVRATKPLAVHPPNELRSVGDLARRVAWASANVPLQERDVWPQLQLIIADELGIPVSKITRDADLLRDLGFG